MKIILHSIRKALYFLCAGIYFLSGIALAQHDVYLNETQYSFEQINPVNVDEPPRPGTRFGPGPEGWIKLRFTINTDGSTSNIEVLDLMPSAFSSRETIKTVESWTFDPAVIDGNAVDWHNNIVVINFDLPEIPNFSGPQFTSPYNEVQELINEGRLDRAKNMAIANIRKGTYSLHDLGLGNMQLTTVEMQRQDLHLAHQAITRATLPEVTQLTNEELEIALLYRFNIELGLGLFMDALDTYQRRSQLSAIATAEPIHQQVEQLQQALDQGYTLSAKGKILDRDEGWFFIPSRRTFTIANTQGDLDSIEAVCNLRKVSMEYQPDVEWSLPESWGECSLKVMGDRNTTFTFYEFID
jgi:hypothetical protein